MKIARENPTAADAVRLNATAPKAPAGGTDPRLAAAEKAAEDFETMFMEIMLKSMRATAKPEEDSNANETYQGMLDSEYAKAMTGAQNFGVRTMILDWMKLNEPGLKEAGSVVGGAGGAGGAGDAGLANAAGLANPSNPSAPAIPRIPSPASAEGFSLETSRHQAKQALDEYRAQAQRIPLK